MLVFTAPFPFYAGNVKLPAGSYIITEPDVNAKIVLIRNIAGTKGEFINFIPTSSLDPQKETDVTFRKYGDTGYLQTLSIEGETDGIEFPRTKAEAKAETLAENTKTRLWNRLCLSAANRTSWQFIRGRQWDL